MIGTSFIHRTDTFRSPLQPRQPASYPSPRDLPPPLEFDFPVSCTSRFPISSIRQDAPRFSSANPPPHPPKPIYPRHDPLHILSQSPPPPPRSYPSVVPAPSVAPGVLADGVLTAKLPSVRQFLDAATIAPPECPPWPSDKRVLALVALSVFYHPLHPAHWAFWNKEQRKATAHMIQSVLDTTPTPILSPIGWIAIPENLWILSSVQSAYGSALASLPWYATYTPTEPESRMNLRKRKPLAILPSAANGACGDETADEDERISPPPRKRAKTRRSTASRSKEAQAKPAATGEPAQDANKQGDRPGPLEVTEAALLLTADVPPTLTKAAKRERIGSPETVISAKAIDAAVQLDPPDADEAPEPRKSLRQRERKAKATNSGSPASVASTLTPSARDLSQARTPSRESSAVTPESVGGESGSSTAVSLCDEDATKSKAPKAVEEIADEEDVEEEEDAEGPTIKRARIARPRAKTSSRSRSTNKNKTDLATDDAKTNMATVQARPKPRSRAKTRRR